MHFWERVNFVNLHAFLDVSQKELVTLNVSDYSENE